MSTIARRRDLVEASCAKRAPHLPAQRTFGEVRTRLGQERGHAGPMTWADECIARASRLSTHSARSRRVDKSRQCFRQSSAATKTPPIALVRGRHMMTEESPQNHGYRGNLPRTGEGRPWRKNQNTNSRRRDGISCMDWTRWSQVCFVHVTTRTQHFRVLRGRGWREWGREHIGPGRNHTLVGLPRIGRPTLPEALQSAATAAKFARAPPGSAKVVRIRAKFGRNRADTGLSRPKCPIWVELGPKLTKCGPISTGIALIWT